MELSLKKMFLFLVTIPFALFFINSCRMNDEIGNSKLNDTLTADEFLNTSEKSDFILLDVRTPEEYSKGFIEKSINLNFYDTINFNSEIVKLNRNIPYLIYCRTDKRSGRTIELMKESGFREVHILKGGIVQWQKENKPLIIKNQK